ncbi:MAG TPA: hypothetical protein VME86_10780 [Acidobacteriaceae bacterium]|nr:hypothetical protein [Acidobacteriaceae bacterium]
MTAKARVTPIRVLMRGLVDYAGLFPPAGLHMMEAVRRYRAYLTGEDHWALGRFVVPVTRLGEFPPVFNEVCCGEREPMWALSILSSGDAVRDAGAIGGLPRGAVQVECVEVKAASVADAEKVLREWSGPVVYVEFAPGEAGVMLPMLEQLGTRANLVAKIRAKIRTGGVTAEAFPTVEQVAEFLLACARARVAFKATAGLHHVVRGEYKLTYEPESARAKMHGFANVFLAALLAWRGEDAAAVRSTLAVEDARTFAFGDEAVRWLKYDAGVDEIEATRRAFAVSYGSCSFEEPVAEAKALGWL